ncbi:MAG: ATP-binding protein [Candidatus Saccharimonadales bacterium]
MKCHISNSVFIGNVDPFIRSFDLDDPSVLEISTHDKWMSVHPVALAMIAGLGMTVPKGNVHIDNISATSGHYLQRMGLLELLGIDDIMHITEKDPSGRFVPLTIVKTAAEQTKFITDMMPLLHLDKAPEQAEAIRYVVSELLRNVLEHAAASNGAIVAAQYYPKTKRIGIGIVDTGVGIKKTINRSHAAWTDAEAMRLALTPGITGTTNREGGTIENAGAGLFFIKSIAVNNHDFFMLYSGNALYKLHKRRGEVKYLHVDPFDDPHALREDMPRWQGTVVGIDISLEQTKRFADLMGVIRQSYTSAIRERRKARYRKVRFE